MVVSLRFFEAPAILMHIALRPLDQRDAHGDNFDLGFDGDQVAEHLLADAPFLLFFLASQLASQLFIITI